MALGKRREEQQEMWVATRTCPSRWDTSSTGNSTDCWRRRTLTAWPSKCASPTTTPALGRPSIPPGVYFRMLLVGYYEGIGSQRGIAWRCGDSLSLREFLGVPLTEETPDHSSLTRVRDRLPLDVHVAVFSGCSRWPPKRDCCRARPWRSIPPHWKPMRR